MINRLHLWQICLIFAVHLGIQGLFQFETL